MERENEGKEEKKKRKERKEGGIRNHTMKTIQQREWKEAHKREKDRLIWINERATTKQETEKEMR